MWPLKGAFKYYVIRLGGWGIKTFDDLDDTKGGGVQDLGKSDDIILERSLTNTTYHREICDIDISKYFGEMIQKS